MEEEMGESRWNKKRWREVEGGRNGSGLASFPGGAVSGSEFTDPLLALFSGAFLLSAGVVGSLGDDLSEQKRVR